MLGERTNGRYIDIYNCISLSLLYTDMHCGKNAVKYCSFYERTQLYKNGDATFGWWGGIYVLESSVTMLVFWQNSDFKEIYAVITGC